MSWASHNVEAWLELERSAAARWLAEQWRVFYNEVPRPVEEFLSELVELLQAEQPKLFEAMLDAGARTFIDESEYGERLMAAAEALGEVR